MVDRGTSVVAFSSRGEWSDRSELMTVTLELGSRSDQAFVTSKSIQFDEHKTELMVGPSIQSVEQRQLLGV